jgi:hypothetical protein
MVRVQGKLQVVHEFRFLKENHEKVQSQFDRSHPVDEG